MTRDFALCVPGGGDDGRCIGRELTYGEHMGRHRGLLARLVTDEGTELGEVTASFLSPHSYRTFLPSAAAAIGAPLEWTQWLAAWNAKGSEVYVRTSGQRTAVLQAPVARIVRGHIGGEDPVGEHELLENLGRFLRVKGLEESESTRRLTELRLFPGKPVVTVLWNPGMEDERAERTENEVVEAATEPPWKETADIVASDNERASPQIGEGYVISISGKRGLRRLHYWGAATDRQGWIISASSSTGRSAQGLSSTTIIAISAGRREPSL